MKYRYEEKCFGNVLVLQTCVKVFIFTKCVGVSVNRYMNIVYVSASAKNNALHHFKTMTQSQ